QFIAVLTYDLQDRALFVFEVLKHFGFASRIFGFEQNRIMRGIGRYTVHVDTALFQLNRELASHAVGALGHHGVNVHTVDQVCAALDVETVAQFFLIEPPALWQLHHRGKKINQAEGQKAEQQDGTDADALDHFFTNSSFTPEATWVFNTRILTLSAICRM